MEIENWVIVITIAYVTLGLVWFPIRNKLLFDVKHNPRPNLGLTPLRVLKNFLIGPFVVVGVAVGFFAIIAICLLIYFTPSYDELS